LIIILNNSIIKGTTMEENINHKSGFVNIIGLPNVGKSSLLNALLGDKMVIVSHKPQTTRHRIFGIMNTDNYQVVFSDTPGIIREESYKMQKAMNDAALSVFEDSDILLVVIDLSNPEFPQEVIDNKIQHLKIPVILVLNKVDLVDEDKYNEQVEEYKKLYNWTQIVSTSALKKSGTDELKELIVSNLQPGPAYYPKDQLSNRPERFFISELIRENILTLYHQEIPYATEVAVTDFKESEKHGKPFVHIYATIFCMRRSQKGILLGKNGSAIKQLGMESRKAIEEYLGKRIYLELHIKIKEKWRDNDSLLKSFGYLH